MTAYYNEIDPFAAQWLRNLIAAGHIAPGDVDERSIADVRPDELAGYTQCHFFAGIGVWSHALRLAGWPDDKPVWTGSCPCQPFSAAGKGAGFADERHLWPFWFHLVSQCRPSVVLGEQVASKDGLGWLDLVQADLEAAGYAVGASDLCAAGVGAPHIRQRLWFVGLADADEQGGSGRGVQGPGQGNGASLGAACERSAGLRATGGVALPDSGQRDGRADAAGRHDGNRQGAGRAEGDGGAAGRGVAGGVEHTIEPGLEGHAGHGDDRHEPGRIGAHEAGPVTEAGSAGRMADADGWQSRQAGAVQSGWQHGQQQEDGRTGDGDQRPGPVNGFWRDADWLFCRDGKWRPVEPGTFPLADGVVGRVGRLRAYGNAISPWPAKAFIESVSDSLDFLEMMA